MNKYPDISEALKKGKEVVDRQVENALLKRALGYQYTEQKLASVEMSNEEYYAKQQFEKQQYKLSNPEATQEEINAHMLTISKYKMVVVEEKVKEVAPDTTAQIFWLKNRKPETWRDKQQIEHSGGVDVNNNPLQQLSVEELKKLIKS